MDESTLRILKDPAVASAFELLAQQLSGADLRSLLIALAADRAAGVSPEATVVQQSTDRFCEPSSLDAVGLANLTAAALQLSHDALFEPVQLSPLAPLGSSATLEAVAQINVLTTMQLCDVSPDPAPALAVVAAARRRLLRDDSDTLRLSAVQRVMRARQFDAPGALPHFSRFGLVSVGRHRGGRRFEVDELTRHVRLLVDLAQQMQPTGTVSVAVSDSSGRRDEAVALVESLSDVAKSELAAPPPDRAGCFTNLYARVSWTGVGESIDLGESGVAPWSSELASDRNERLVVGGLDIDRLLIVMTRRGVGH